MSIRTLATRIFQNGKIILRSLRNNEHCSTYTRGQLDKIHVVQVGKPLGPLPQGGSRTVERSSTPLAYFGAQARRLFVDNILKRVTNSLAVDLRKKAARRLLYGDSAPFFALVGVSLASGTGILTKEDEFEGVCWEIKEAVSKLQWTKPHNDRNYESISAPEDSPSLKNFTIGPLIAKGCSAVVYAARLKEETAPDSAEGPTIDKLTQDPSSFPFALKMMFNYDAESNALTILKAMYRETVPARKYNSNEQVAVWEQRMAENKKILPPHSNIVAMYYVFADRIPLLPGSNRMYPDALPPRLNPEGSGRNMSLFLLMKRYDTTLKQYLKSKMENEGINVRESVLLLAQLLEGLVHMNAHGIAHRDLKSDNILLDTSEEVTNCPTLVITDFGCCLADKHHGLHLPYNSHDVDRGGNSTLMAPEIITAEPGPFTRINYSKADLWTVGTIAYELFGMRNPFYGGRGEKAMLQNFNYRDEDLPMLAEGTPPIVAALVKNILIRNDYKRLSVEMAATIMQLYLWAPSSWLRRHGKLPSSSEIIQWLVCLTTKILCEGREMNLPTPEESSYINGVKSNSKNYRRMSSARSGGRRTMPEYQLIANFLARVSLPTIRSSFRWIQKHAAAVIV